MSGGLEEGVRSSLRPSGAILWLTACPRSCIPEGLEDGVWGWPWAESMGNVCRLAGVVGGVGMEDRSSRGGTEKTTGLEDSCSLLMSITLMGADWLRRFT